MSHVILKDALRQIVGRLVSALGGFVVIKLMTPYLGPLRFGDYSTILKYFAIRSALADFGLYVLAIKKLGEIKQDQTQSLVTLSSYYSRFVTSRVITILVVYACALSVAYVIPSYTSNPYLLYGLPIGMLFSASFMMAGILQLPLQLYGQMQDTTIALTLARVVQIVILLVLIFIVYPGEGGTGLDTYVFVLILGSVVCSALAQGIYVWRRGSKYISLQWIRDLQFTRQEIKSNRQYGFAYYLSSFHTLIVVIILSIFFPTVQGWTYVGIWAFALQLMELALIVPSSMANSLLHKISQLPLQDKRLAFGNLLNLILWIAVMCCGNFWIFGSTIIGRIGGEQYLTSSGAGIHHIGSDFILPFLGIVLILSFTKQLFNYIFVSLNLHNKIFWINLIGVCLGSLVGIPLIYFYNLWGGIITQILLELLFTGGALYLAYRHDCLPRLASYASRSRLPICGLLSIAMYSVVYLVDIHDHTILQVLILITYNLLCLGGSYPSLHMVLRGLKF